MVKEEFDRLGWFFTFQPPNFPLSNVDDAAIFPAVAKAGTALGGLLHHGRYLQGETLWDVIKQAWEEYNNDAIARAFVYHCQVAAATYKDGGADDWVKAQGGLNFGVRRVCRPYFSNCDERGERQYLAVIALRQLKKTAKLQDKCN